MTQQQQRKRPLAGTPQAVAYQQTVAYQQDPTPGQPAAALRLTDVTKRYPSGFALDSISFDLPQGYIMGLIGPNGAGKSTLIKLILNMTKRDEGAIEVLGQDALTDEEEIKQNLGVVFSSNYFYDNWNARQVRNAVAPLYSAWDDDAFSKYLTLFKIDSKKRTKQLSRGMQTKLALAVALSHDAKLLILDEPTSGLDVLARDELMDILMNYIEDGQHTVLFSTHITSDLDRSADFITYITQGKLYFTGPKDELKEDFLLLKGGPEEIDAIRDKAIGIRQYSSGFDALLRTEDADSTMLAQLTVEHPSIDDIIRLTNTNVSGSEER
jgi:ABC-2 type transport system ATP-binding protein